MGRFVAIGYSAVSLSGRSEPLRPAGAITRKHTTVVLQTLFHIPTHVFGIPLFGFGLLLALWAVGSVGLLAWLIYRQGFNRDTQRYLPLLLLFGALIAFVLPALAGDDGLPIRGYGAMLVVAIGSATWLAARRAQQMGLNPELIFSLAFWVALGGILGARVFYVVEYWDQLRGDTPAQTLRSVIDIAQGGLVVYGGLVGGGIALLIGIRHYRLPGLALCDLVAPSVALGMGLGRLGCFLNGCCFGGPSDLPWAVTFPHGSPPFVRQAERGELYLHGLKLTGPMDAPATLDGVAPGSPADEAGLQAEQQIVAINGQPIASNRDAYALLLRVRGGSELSILVDGETQARTFKLPAALPRTVPVHPTQLYSAVDGMVLFLFLMAWYPYRRRDGEVTALLLTIHPVTRFLLEVIRTDEPPIGPTGLTIAQNISLLILVGAGLLWVYLSRRPQGSALPVQSSTQRLTGPRQASTSSTTSPSTSGSGRSRAS